MIVRPRTCPLGLLFILRGSILPTLRDCRLTDVTYRLMSERLMAMVDVQTACERLR
jgi:predicted membrane chloride channel (bestrophin family)